MPKRELLYEWMHRFELPSGTTVPAVIRVWTKATTDSAGEFNEQARAIDRIIKASRWPHDLILSEIATEPFVNAAEMLNAHGNGRLVYGHWSSFNFRLHKTGSCRGLAVQP